MPYAGSFPFDKTGVPEAVGFEGSGLLVLDRDERLDEKNVPGTGEWPGFSLEDSTDFLCILKGYEELEQEDDGSLKLLTESLFVNTRFSEFCIALVAAPAIVVLVSPSSSFSLLTSATDSLS